jgi:hypothetical protein
MKPPTNVKLGHPKGFTVRIATKDRDEFASLYGQYKCYSMNELMATMTGQIVDMCRSNPFVFPAKSLLAKVGKRSKASWLRLAKSDVRRTMTNDESVPVRITFPERRRQDLRALSQELRWAEGQLILESLDAFCQLAASRQQLSFLPPVIELSRGRAAYISPEEPEVLGKPKKRRESVQDVLDAVNQALGFE